MRAAEVRAGRMYAFPTNPGPWYRYAVPARVMAHAPRNRVLVLFPDGVPASAVRLELPRAALVWLDADALISTWEEWPELAAETRADLTALVSSAVAAIGGHDAPIDRRTPGDGGGDPLVVAPDRAAAAPAGASPAEPRPRLRPLRADPTQTPARGRPALPRAGRPRRVRRYSARIRLLRGLCSTSARPRCSRTGGTYVAKRPRYPLRRP